jgi:SHS2 domain-containing protein
MFEILEHPSDIGVLARAPTRSEALIAVSTGVMGIIVNPEPFKATEERWFRAPGMDDAAKVVNWLNEILFFFDTEGLVFTDFTIDSWTEQEIVGRARGDFYNAAKHEFRTAIKAATFHQFESHAIPEGWEIRVFLDV